MPVLASTILVEYYLLKVKPGTVVDNAILTGRIVLHLGDELDYLQGDTRTGK